MLLLQKQSWPLPPTSHCLFFDPSSGCFQLPLVNMLGCPPKWQSGSWCHSQCPGLTSESDSRLVNLYLCSWDISLNGHRVSHLKLKSMMILSLCFLWPTQLYHLCSFWQPVWVNCSQEQRINGRKVYSEDKIMHFQKTHLLEEITRTYFFLLVLTRWEYIVTLRT